MFEASRRALAGLEASGLVVGGGTLIGHAKVRVAVDHFLAAEPSTPLIALGSGVEDPLFHEDGRADVVEELESWVISFGGSNI